MKNNFYLKTIFIILNLTFAINYPMEEEDNDPRQELLDSIPKNSKQSLSLLQKLSRDIPSQYELDGLLDALEKAGKFGQVDVIQFILENFTYCHRLTLQLPNVFIGILTYHLQLVQTAPITDEKKLVNIGNSLAFLYLYLSDQQGILFNKLSQFLNKIASGSNKVIVRLLFGKILDDIQTKTFKL